MLDDGKGGKYKCLLIKWHRILTVIFVVDILNTNGLADILNTNDGPLVVAKANKNDLWVFSST